MDSNAWKDVSVSTELSALTLTATERGMVHFDFGVVFADLRRYKLENDHLSIPESHPLFASIVDGLSSLGMEELLRRRWDEQYASLRAFQGKYGNCLVPEAHPTLGAWARIQCDHFGRYRQQLPSPLTKERFHKLKEIDFGELAEVVNRKGARRGRDLRQPRGRPAGVSVSFVRPKSSSPRPAARAGRNPPARPTDGAHRHAVPVSSFARGRRRSVSAPKYISFRPTNLSRSAPNRASMRKNGHVGHVRESKRKPLARQIQSFDNPKERNPPTRQIQSFHDPKERKPPTRKMQSFHDPKERKPPTRQMQSIDDSWEEKTERPRGPSAPPKPSTKGAFGNDADPPDELSWAQSRKFDLEIGSTKTRRTGRGARPSGGNVHEKRRLRRSEFEPSSRGRGKSTVHVIKEELGGDDGDSSPERHLSKDDIHVDVHEKRRMRRSEFGPNRRGRAERTANSIEEETGGDNGDSSLDSSLARLFSEDDIHIDYTSWTELDSARDSERWEAWRNRAALARSVATTS